MGKPVTIELIGEIGREPTTAKIVVQQIKSASASSIKLVIDSLGGNVGHGAKILQALEAHPWRVDVVIKNAASMAAILALTGDHRVIIPSGKIRLHRPHYSGRISYAGSKKLRETADRIDRFEDQFVQHIAARTGQSLAESRRLLSMDTQLNSIEALIAGFAMDLCLKGASAAPSPAEESAMRAPFGSGFDAPTFYDSRPISAGEVIGYAGLKFRAKAATIAAPGLDPFADPENWSLA